MPFVTVRLVVPEGMTANGLRAVLESHDFLVGEPLATHLVVQDPDDELQEDDEVDLTPDEEDDSSDDQSK